MSTFTPNPKFDKLLAKHAAVIARASRELAMNFNIPARDIISGACAEMRISEKVWRELQSYQIRKEQGGGGK